MCEIRSSTFHLTRQYTALGTGLKLGVEKFGVKHSGAEISCNRPNPQAHVHELQAQDQRRQPHGPEVAGHSRQAQRDGRP